MSLNKDSGICPGRQLNFLLVLIVTAFLQLPLNSVSAGGHTPPDSVQIETGGVDTLKLLSDQTLKSPWGAVLRSAVLPGWGQVYNEKYIKGVLAFGVNGVLAWRIADYQKRWKDTNIESNREKRNLFSWYLGLAYLITMVDAYVDATLFGFEEAMDISCSPSIEDPSSWAVTLRIQF